MTHLQHWIDRLLSHKRGATYDYTRGKLQNVARVMGPERDVRTIGPDVVDDYVAARRRDVSDATISKEYGALVQVLRLAKRSGAWSGDLDVLRPMGLRSAGTPGTRALTAAEVRLLLAACPGTLRAIVALAVATGARRGELMRLRPEHVTKHTIRIPGTKTTRSDAVLPILEPYRGLVEMARAHLPIQYRGNLSRELERACERAGIERCCANDLRRTHITILREGGLDSESARALLRHSPASRLLERVYDQSRPEVLAERAAPVLRAIGRV
jgi:integrase